MPKFAQGIYLGTIEAYGLGESEKKKTPYFFVEATMHHVAEGGNWVDVPTPEKRTVFFYLTPPTDKSQGSIEISLRQISEMGFVGDMMDALTLSAEKKQNVTFECTDDLYDGKIRERWALYGHRKPMEHHKPESNAVRMINAHWAKLRPPGRPVFAPPPPVVTTPSIPEIDETKIPF